MKSLKVEKLKSFLKQDIGSKKIDKRIVSLFLKQLSLLLGSGISLDDSLRIIRNQNINKKLTKTLSLILEELNKGKSTYQAFLTQKEAFGPLTIAFIKSGDESGKLGEILQSLSVFLAEDTEKKSKIKQALLYPSILLIITILVVMAMMVFVLPTFVQVFENANQNLPISTRLLIFLSTITRKYIIFFLLFLLILILFLVYKRKDYRFRLKSDEFIFKLKIFKNFRILNIEYQLASLLSVLKNGEIDIIDSVNIIKDAFSNYYLKSKFENIVDSLMLGKNLSKSFKEEKIFSNLFVSMLEVGEDSGNMIQALDKTSDYFSNEYLYRLNKISQIAEPVLILIMALIVGFVVFSVAIPMFDSINNLNY